VEGGHDFRVPGSIPLPAGAVVPPSAVHRFTVTLVAPDAAGTYRLEWRMARPAAGFFGPSVEQSVKVVCPP